MRLRFAALAIAAGTLLAGCATPVEDLDRYLNFTWSLEPETLETLSESGEQGEILFEWKATAQATHYIPSKGLKLIETRSSRGVLFCGHEVTFQCYEDRDGNGAFDHRWNTRQRGVEPKTYTYAITPQPMEAGELTYTAIPDGESEAILESKLGLVYNGPTQGLLTEEFDFDFAIGEFQIGWITSKTAPRKPDGQGWHALRTISLFYLKEKAAVSTVTPLDLTYTILEMTAAGDLKVELSAAFVSAMKFTEKFDYDFEGGEPPAEVSETSVPAPSRPVARTPL